ncbi:MAG TPA: arylesterase [Methylotenera sp.]|nr:arylesterase [Methylotenera sp.]HPH04746.1 arylesterase [Methylotenera sp.]HPN01162.1 arylesterase [Methylotenera sp.]
MRKWLILFVLLLAACDGGEKHSAIPKGATVLILGDSLSYGTGANVGEDYPTLLASATGWQMINAGIPGDTSAEGLARLPALLENHHPKLLIVALGGNDFLQKLPASQTSTNINSILAQAKVKGVSTLLVAIPEFSPIKAAVGNLSDHPLYAQIAEETSTPLAEEVFSEVLSDNSLKSDQVHPNAAGYKAVSNEMLAELKRLGFVR